MKKRNILAGIASVVGMLFISLPAHAELWGSTAAEFLVGKGYERTPEDQEILTVKHAGGWKTGDTFFFVDFTSLGEDTKTFAHAEWQGRLSLLRTLGSGARDGLFKDFYLSAQVDLTNNPFTNKRTDMYGIGFDFNVPGFRFVKLNIHHRDDPTLPGSTEQITLVWNKGFKIGEADFEFSGFADFTGEEGGTVSNVLTTPQLLWHATEHVAIGIEYQYWQDRLGIKGLDESLTQAMVRWTF